MPFISVIIPSYNRKEMMLEAVNSVLNQTLKRDEYEIIVVKNYHDYDDLLKEKGVKVIYTDNTWFSYKIYLGGENAEGDVLCFLDDDDLFFNNKLEIVKSVFEDSDIDWYRNRHIEINTNKEPLSSMEQLDTFIEYTNKKGKIPINEILKIKKINVILSLTVNLSSQCVKRDIFRKYSQILSKAERSIDELNFLLVLLYGKYIYIDNTPLTLYRIHGNNISHYDFKSIEDKRRYAIDFYKAYKSYSTIIEALKQQHGNFIYPYLKLHLIKMKLYINIFNIYLDKDDLNSIKKGIGNPLFDLIKYAIKYPQYMLSNYELLKLLLVAYTPKIIRKKN